MAGELLRLHEKRGVNVTIPGCLGLAQFAALQSFCYYIIYVYCRRCVPQPRSSTVGTVIYSLVAEIAFAMLILAKGVLSILNQTYDPRKVAQAWGKTGRHWKHLEIDVKTDFVARRHHSFESLNFSDPISQSPNVQHVDHYHLARVEKCTEVDIVPKTEQHCALGWAVTARLSTSFARTASSEGD